VEVSNPTAERTVSSQVGKSARELGVEGVINWDRSKSDIDEWSSFKKIPRSRLAAGTTGKTLEEIKV
jgi:hypothetical protein